MTKRLVGLTALTQVVAAAALCAQGVAGQLEVEGSFLSTRDLTAVTFPSLPRLVLGQVVDSPVPRPPDIAGPSLRVRAALGPAGRASRVEAIFQRFADEDSSAVEWSPEGSSYPHSRELALEDAAASLDLGWSHVLAGRPEAPTVRSWVGYRYLHRRWSERSDDVTPSVSDAGYRHSRERTSLDGHGLHVGLEAGRGLGRRLRVEGKVGAAWLRADYQTASEGMSDSIAGPVRYDLSASTKRGLATWDLGARLCGAWGPVSLGLGYRFERWEARARPLTFDGPTASLSFRFGS